MPMGRRNCLSTWTELLPTGRRRAKPWPLPVVCTESTRILVNVLQRFGSVSGCIGRRGRAAVVHGVCHPTLCTTSVPPCSPEMYATFDIAFVAHLARFKGIAPRPSSVPLAVWINRPKKDTMPPIITPNCSLRLVNKCVSLPLTRSGSSRQIWRVEIYRARQTSVISAFSCVR